MKNSKHMIDFIFPIALFFVFASTALIILLFSANIYQNVVNESNTNFQQGTVLSYITEKIHQNDSAGDQTISLSEFDQIPALAISQTYGEHTYTTYIYELNGELKEIFIQDGITASADTGTTIMQIKDLEITEISEDLYQISCTSTDGNRTSTVISTHSKAN